MNICPKCNSYRTAGPFYQKDTFGNECLQYKCRQCGYEQSKPTTKGQSRLASLFESFINIAIGFVISTLAWMFIVPVIWPELKPHSGLDTAFGVTVLFTVLSLTRNYVIRRIANFVQEVK